MDDELENAMRADPLLHKIGQRDLRLAQLSYLMSQVIHAQSLLTQVKRSGQTFDELDEWLLTFAAYSDKIVQLMNERMQQLPPLQLEDE